MAYTKYSLTPANNTAAPPDGAPEGMLPSAVNDTMRDMMAQIRDCGDGIRDGTYTMTAPKITGGTITGATFSAGTVSTPSITTTGDTNTGIFFPAADTIAFTEGGVESMRIDSSGNLGIGVTPSAWSAYKALQVGSNTSLAGSTSASVALLSTNAYFDGSSYKYITTDAATQYQQNTGEHIWRTAASGSAGATLTFSERMRINSSGNVGIGTSSPSSKLTVQGAIRHEFASNTALYTTLNYDGISVVGAQDAYYLVASGQNQTWYVGATERMRITSGGDVAIGTTDSAATRLAASSGNGTVIQGASYSVFTRNATTSAQAVMGINTTGVDSKLIAFYAQGIEEGDISVSGSTVSYNGGHLSRWSQLLDNSKDDAILKGTVLTNLDDMCVWEKDGVVAENEQLNKMKVSDVEGDTNVAGVFVNWTIDEKYGVDDMNVAMTGDMIIRIANGVVVQKGDLLMSAGDGTAKPQGDDIVRSKTIAKVTSNHVTCTYADGSYCVPCVLMAC
jgi:hypothetical protein